MSPSIQYVLTVGPLGFYLWLIAFWQSGRRPRVVSGLVDFTLLAFGVGGVIAFGPLGQLAARKFFTRPDVFDWLTIVSSLGLVATVLARGSIGRLVVYHASAVEVASALEAWFRDSNMAFARTLHGYEDHDARRGLRVEVTRIPASVTIEAIGPDAEGLIREVRSGLRKSLKNVSSPPSYAAFGLYFASLAVVVGPLVFFLMTQPHAREALRAFLQRIRGG